MAVEDGAVLGALFSSVTEPKRIPSILQTFEELRKPRTTKVVQGSIEQGRMCKLPDGHEQRERDQWFAIPDLEEYPLHFASPSFRDFLLGYDAYAEVERLRAAR